jgi:hypothetical protein
MGVAAGSDEDTRLRGELETLSWFVRLSASFGHGVEHTRIEGFQTEMARKFFDLEDIAHRYADELPDSYMRMTDTPENRRTAALGAVAEATSTN